VQPWQKKVRPGLHVPGTPGLSAYHLPFTITSQSAISRLLWSMTLASKSDRISRLNILIQSDADGSMSLILMGLLIGEFHTAPIVSSWLREMRPYFLSRCD